MRSQIYTFVFTHRVGHISFRLSYVEGTSGLVQRMVTVTGNETRDT